MFDLFIRSCVGVLVQSGSSTGDLHCQMKREKEKQRQRKRERKRKRGTKRSAWELNRRRKKKKNEESKCHSHLWELICHSVYSVNLTELSLCLKGTYTRTAIFLYSKQDNKFDRKGHHIAFWVNTLFLLNVIHQHENLPHGIWEGSMRHKWSCHKCQKLHLYVMSHTGHVLSYVSF